MPFNLEEKRRGELVHRLFSSVDYLDKTTEERLGEGCQEARPESGR